MRGLVLTLEMECWSRSEFVGSWLVGMVWRSGFNGGHDLMNDGKYGDGAGEVDGEVICWSG